MFSQIKWLLPQPPSCVTEAVFHCDICVTAVLYETFILKPPSRLDCTLFLDGPFRPGACSCSILLWDPVQSFSAEGTALFQAAPSTTHWITPVCSSSWIVQHLPGPGLALLCHQSDSVLSLSNCARAGLRILAGLAYQLFSLRKLFPWLRSCIYESNTQCSCYPSERSED